MNRLPIAGLSVLLAAATLSATSHQALQAQTRNKNLPSMARPIKLEGIVAPQPSAKEFVMRANGETYRVRPLQKVGMSGVRGGDRVRVWGRPTGLIISYANVRVLASRASDAASDYIPATGTTTITSPGGRNAGRNPNSSTGGTMGGTNNTGAAQ